MRLAGRPRNTGRHHPPAWHQERQALRRSRSKLRRMAAWCGLTGVLELVGVYALWREHWWGWAVLLLAPAALQLAAAWVIGAQCRVTARKLRRYAPVVR